MRRLRIALGVLIGIGLALLAGWNVGRAEAPAAPSAPVAAAELDTVNPVIGDISWHHAYGDSPGPQVDEKERVRTHLRYALARLRHGDSAELAPAVRARREAALDALGRYVQRGEFPQRTDDSLSGRRPRFIDDEGTHCAVAHMIAASGESELTQSLQRSYEYSYVQEMNSPELGRWAAHNGLSVDELAMVQPTYPRHWGYRKIKRQVAAVRFDYTLDCARRHRPVRAIRLNVGGLNGRVHVGTDATDEFSKCFVKRLQKLQIVPAEADAKRTYRFSWELWMATPQSLLEPLLQRLALDPTTTGCGPKQKTPPTEVKFEVESNDKAFEVRVKCSPANDELDRCLERHVHRQLQHLGTGPQEVRFSVERQL